MELRRIDSDFVDIARLSEINDEAFPEEERIPSDNLLPIMHQYGCTAWAMYDEGKMVGFTVVMHRSEYGIGYIWFFAIAADCRSRGLGSKALQKLQDIYADCQLILDMERIDTSAPNYNQRIRRLKFYQKCGFTRAYIGMNYLGMNFELMCNQGRLRIDNFKDMIDKVAGRLFRPVFTDIAKEQRVMFLHGFFASGECIPAVALRQALKGKAEVISPDLPLHPRAAISLISNLCDTIKPDLLVGNSCGSFYAQLIATAKGIPALLGNPHFEMTRFLRERIGQHQYKSPRRDGQQQFTIDEALIAEFAALEATQFDACHDDFKDKVWALFGDNDTLAHYEPLFLQHYSHTFHFPGGHTPTAEEVTLWYIPIVEKMLKTCSNESCSTNFAYHASALQ